MKTALIGAYGHQEYVVSAAVESEALTASAVPHLASEDDEVPWLPNAGPRRSGSPKTDYFIRLSIFRKQPRRSA